MIIQHNMLAEGAGRAFNINNKEKAKYTEKLSTGYKINRAADNAAGLAISEEMRAQVRGMKQGSTNSRDGISLFNTADGAMQEIDNMLHRMRELCVQATNDTNTTGDRAAIDEEVQAIRNEIKRVSEQTEFNTKKILLGTVSEVFIQSGSNSFSGADFELPKVTLSSLAIVSINVKTRDKASSYIDICAKAVEKMNDYRSSLGAYVNRLEHSQSVADNTAENLQAAESKLRDTDMADAMVQQSKTSILEQAITSMLTQANNTPKGVLSLLQ